MNYISIFDILLFKVGCIIVVVEMSDEKRVDKEARFMQNTSQKGKLIN